MNGLDVSTLTSWTTLIHGEAGVGKSWLADTARPPRLVLDAEGGSQFTPSRKVLWDPQRFAPPGVEGCAPGQEVVTETTRVLVRDFRTMELIYRWLNSGAHFFRSVILDSISEIQKRCLDAIVGSATPERQHWATLLYAMDILARQYRDLRDHPVSPIETTVFLALNDPDKKGARRPLIRGQLGNSLPGFVDTQSYMGTTTDAEGNIRRTLISAPYPGYEAKDRTDAIPAMVYIADPKLGLPGWDLSSLLGAVQKSQETRQAGGG